MVESGGRIDGWEHGTGNDGRSVERWYDIPWWLLEHGDEGGENHDDLIDEIAG